MKHDIETIAVIVVMCWICGMLLYFGGCAVAPITSPPTPGSIASTIHSTDWLMSILLMGSVAGLFAAFNGLKVGWAGVAACIGGIMLKAALSSAYVYWVSGFIFLACLISAVASVVYKNTALREIILGAQVLKQTQPNGNVILKEQQSKPTQKLVQEIKSVLKWQDKI